MSRGVPSAASTSALGARSVNGRMHPADLEALADLVADRLAERLGSPAAVAQLVGVKTLAAALGVKPGYVYEHADRLGVVRVGDGPKPRLRFDLERARELAARLPTGENPQDPGSAITPRHRRLRRPRGSGRVPAPVPANPDREAA